MAFIKVNTGRNNQSSLLGIANIESIIQEKDQATQITMASGKSFAVNQLSPDEIEKALRGSRLAILDLTAEAQKNQEARDEAARLAAEEKAGKRPAVTQANQTAPSAVQPDTAVTA